MACRRFFFRVLVIKNRENEVTHSVGHLVVGVDKETEVTHSVGHLVAGVDKESGRFRLVQGAERIGESPW